MGIIVEKHLSFTLRGQFFLGIEFSYRTYIAKLSFISGILNNAGVILQHISTNNQKLVQK